MPFAFGRLPAVSSWSIAVAASNSGSAPFIVRLSSIPAISIRLISLVPSKIRFTRWSRYARSTGYSSMKP